jgi:hypothetical protein
VVSTLTGSLQRWLPVVSQRFDVPRVISVDGITNTRRPSCRETTLPTCSTPIRASRATTEHPSHARVPRTPLDVTLQTCSPDYRHDRPRQGS